MIQVGEQLCHVDTCTRPGCSRAAGCQGHTMREGAPSYYKARVEALVAEAARYGVVLVLAPADSGRAGEVPTRAIGRLLHQAMEQAVANGANSVSMPDDLVEIAYWLAATPQPAPSGEPP